MKKILLGMAMMSLMAGMAACSDKDDYEQCIVGKTVEGCIDGMYVKCERIDDDSAKGRLERYSIYQQGDLNYKCGDDDRLEPVLKCANGIFSDNGNEFIYSDRAIFRCDGNTIVDVTDTYTSLCIGNDRIYFDAGAGSYMAQNCADQGKVCEQMSKGKSFSAVCVEAGKVNAGCKSATAYGKCDGNTLVICSNPDKSQGKTLRIDCGTISSNHQCMLVEKSGYGYDCALTCGEVDGEIITDFGSCNGSHLMYCQQNGIQSEVNCSLSNKSCGFNTSYYDCI